MPPNFNKSKGTANGGKPAAHGNSPIKDDLPSLAEITRVRTKTFMQPKLLRSDLIDTKPAIKYQNADPGNYISQGSQQWSYATGVNMAGILIDCGDIAASIGLDKNNQWKVEIDSAIMQYKARMGASSTTANTALWFHCIFGQFKGEQFGTFSPYAGALEFPFHVDSMYTENYNIEPIGQFSLTPGFDDNIYWDSQNNRTLYVSLASGTIDFTNFLKAYNEKFYQNDIKGTHLPKYYITTHRRFSNASQTAVDFIYRTVVSYHLVKAKGL